MSLHPLYILESSKTAVEVEADVPKPSPRCNCSFTATLAQKPSEVGRCKPTLA